MEENSDASRILLFLFGGDEMRKTVHDMGDVEEDSPYTEVVNALEAHFEAVANPDRAKYEARKSRQESGETIDAFYSRVCRLVRRYEGRGGDEEIRMQIVVGCRSGKLRAMIFRQPGIPVQDMLELGRALEEESAPKRTWELDADAEAWLEEEKGMTPCCAPEDVEAQGRDGTPQLRNRRGRDPGRSEGLRSSQEVIMVGGSASVSRGIAVCLNCGQTSHPVDGCWARGRKCIACGLKGHVAMMCRGGNKKRRRKRSPGHWSPTAPGRGEAALMVERQEQEM